MAENIFKISYKFFHNAVASTSTQILQLEKRLQDQVAVRGVLEKTLGGMPVSHDSKNEIPLPKVPIFLLSSIKHEVQFKYRSYEELRVILKQM